MRQIGCLHMGLYFSRQDSYTRPLELRMDWTGRWSPYAASLAVRRFASQPGRADHRRQGPDWWWRDKLERAGMPETVTASLAVTMPSVGRLASIMELAEFEVKHSTHQI